MTDKRDLKSLSTLGLTFISIHIVKLNVLIALLAHVIRLSAIIEYFIIKTNADKNELFYYAILIGIFLSKMIKANTISVKLN